MKLQKKNVVWKLNKGKPERISKQKNVPKNVKLCGSISNNLNLVTLLNGYLMVNTFTETGKNVLIYFDGSAEHI